MLGTVFKSWHQMTSAPLKPLSRCLKCCCDVRFCMCQSVAAMYRNEHITWMQNVNLLAKELGFEPQGAASNIIHHLMLTIFKDGSRLRLATRPF
eukprot:1159390-Pelagomonas_calceolata.AAC.5